MKLCVLGPVNTVTRNAGIIKDAFPELDVYEAAYDVYTEALDMIDQIQQEADMVLFPGKASYALCKRSRRQLIPWEYLPRHISSLHRTLLEVQRRFHCGICRISYDTLDSSLILTAYQEIGFRAEDLRLYVAEQRLLDPGYLDYLMEFHQNNYCRNGVSCCITGLTEIAGRLNQLKIPCAVTLPASTLVIDTVKRLQLRYQAQLNLESWIVVIMLEVSFAGNYSIMGEDDYGYLANRIKVLENIYSFSSRIDGVVVEDTPKSFLIFTTRKLIELETNHFQYLDLLDILNICRAENIAVGIGCGNTACESRSHARTAIEMAKKASSNCAYVVLEDGSVLKPLISRQESPANEIQKSHPCGKAGGTQRHNPLCHLEAHPKKRAGGVHLSPACLPLRVQHTHHGPHPAKAPISGVLQGHRHVFRKRVWAAQPGLSIYLVQFALKAACISPAALAFRGFLSMYGELSLLSKGTVFPCF